MAWNTEMPRTLLSHFDAIYIIHWSIRSLFLPSSKPKIPRFISIKLVKATRIKLRWNTTVVAFSECWKQKLLHSRASKVKLKATFCFVSAFFFRDSTSSVLHFSIPEAAEIVEESIIISCLSRLYLERQANLLPHWKAKSMPHKLRNSHSKPFSILKIISFQ